MPNEAPSAYELFHSTDATWAAELRRKFGAAAGDVRYTPQGHGEPGTELRRLYDARTEAAERFLEDCRRARSVAPNCEM